MATKMPSSAGGAGLDESSVREVVDRYVAAWNKHDAKALTGFYSEHGEVRTFTGDKAKSHSEIEQLFTRLFQGTYKDARSSWTVSSVRFLRPDLAAIDGTMKVTGGRGPFANYNGFVTAVLGREKDRWALEIITAGGIPATAAA